MAESAIGSPHRNPNSRSSEINNPMRRSFGGNPFAKPSIVAKQKGFSSVTPANSPSDITRRSFPSLSRDHEDKENGKEHELKPARVRSPSVLKGTKNFMSPTISAASKVAASPKKKILAEKNESLRVSDGKASVSFSDVLEFIDAQPETDMNLNHDTVAAELEAHSIPKEQSTHLNDSKTDMDSDFQVADLEVRLIPKEQFTHLNDSKTDMDNDFPVSELEAHLIHEVQSTPMNDSRSRTGSRVFGEDSVNLDWSSIGSIPSLDADPVDRPYDPETNFTSPRPQFLRYRPNPRIEEYLNRERQGKGLEDNFTSDSSSDAEFTEETESQSEDVSSDEALIGELMKEDIVQDDEEVSDEAMQGEEVSGHEEVLHVSETSSMNKEAVKGKRDSKLHFMKRPKTVAFLLTLLLACLSVSVTDSPMLGLFLKDASYSNIYLPAKFTGYDVKAHLDGLAQSFEFWYDNSISYFSELVYKVREDPKLGTLNYINLTDLYDNRYLVENVLQPEPMTGWERVEAEVEPLEEKGRPQMEVEENEESEFEEHDDKKFVEEHSILETEVHFTPETINLESQEIQESNDFSAPNTETDYGSNMEAPTELSEAESDLHPFVETESTEVEESSTEKNSKLDPSAESTENSEATSFNWLKDELLKLNASHGLGIAFLVLALLAATTLFILVKKQNPPPLCSAPIPENQNLTKKSEIIPKSATASFEHSFQERLSSSHYSPMEVDVIGESCPSGTSSFQKSSYYTNKGVKGDDDSSEAQSQDRKKTRKNYMRESLASSDDHSVGSLSSSYGSFTTYEKISAKRVNAEEITPVRRSSRIRKQVMSP